MAERPTTIREWASNSGALKNEPVNSFKKTGFSVSQPAVNFVNWVLYNIYQWIDYFDENLSSGAGSGFTYTHSSSRSRIELPFTFNSTPALSQIEVLKKTEESVGGVSGTSNDGSGAVTAGTMTSSDPSLTFSSGPFNTPQYTSDTSGEWNGQGSSPGSGFSLVVSSNVDGQGTSGVIYSGSGELRSREGAGILRTDQSSSPIRLSTFNVLNSGTANRILLSDLDQALGADYYTEFFTDTVYLIAANTEADIASGDCIIWRLQSPAFSSGDNDDFYEFNNLVPVYNNADVSINLNFFRCVRSYAVTGGMGSTTGSSISADITISGVAWNVDDYQYNPTANTLALTLTGSQTNQNLFHTFRIRDANGNDLVVLESSDATFASSVWTWNVPDDPITADGTYTFVFQTSGSGVSVFRWVAVTAGLSVEDYAGVRYLNVGSAAAANNDVLLVRKA